MIWYILIILFIILLLWILFCQVISFMNSERNQSLLTFPWVFKGIVVPTEGLFYVRGLILLKERR